MNNLSKELQSSKEGIVKVAKFYLKRDKENYYRLIGETEQGNTFGISPCENLHYDGQKAEIIIVSEEEQI